MGKMDRELLNRSMSKNAHIKTKFLELEVVKTSGVNLWVDFGCTDGEVTKAIADKAIDCGVIGYDRDDDESWPAPTEGVTFTNKFEHVTKHTIDQDSNVGVFLGSVLHEAYTENMAPMVWERVTQLSPSIVVVRDMMYWPEPGDSREGIGAVDVVNAIVGAAEKNHPKHWMDFKKKWCARGCNWRQALHFLLKYRYRKNWSYENREDYLIMSPQLLLKSAEEHGYYPIHMEAMSLEFLKDTWKRDLGIELNHPTHGLFVFKNRRFA